MKCIATHPIQAEGLSPYTGKPLLAVTHSGDVICGIMDGVRDGKLVLKPPGRPPTQLQASAVKRSMGKVSASKRGKKVLLTPKAGGKVKLSYYPGFGFGGYPGGYPGGFGFGFAEGLAVAIPLFLLASLFAFPFFI